MPSTAELAKARVARPEPETGHVELAAVFERATGARLLGVESLVASVPHLFRGLLADCDIAFHRRSSHLVLVIRFARLGFGMDVRRRLEFWVARAGGRCLLLSAAGSKERASFAQHFDRAEAKARQVTPSALAGEAFDLFTRAGAPRDRRRQVSSRPILAMDAGGPGWEGVSYDRAARSLFVPGALSPPAGDELVISLRFSGVAKPLESPARVSEVRVADAARAGQPPGFMLALVAPPPALLEALEKQFPGTAAPAAEARRSFPRYAVNAPVVVKPMEAAERKEPTLEFPVPAVAPQPQGQTAVIEYATDQELAADYVENLSQGGAFIRTASPAQLRTRLKLELKLPGGDLLSAPAEVVYVSDKGMGVKFDLDEAGQIRLAAAIARISARPRRALVVEDDAVVRQMIADALADRGFEVLTAPDGAAGLAVLAEELLALDLLVTDVKMPNMDGETLVRTIRRAGGESELAIVVVTGSPGGPVEKRLERDGADAVLDKSLGAELVAQASDAVLERRRLAHVE